MSNVSEGNATFIHYGEYAKSLSEPFPHAGTFKYCSISHIIPNHVATVYFVRVCVCVCMYVYA
jgi:hypothetical protein